MPRTGNTQGIRLRIKPPSSAISTTCHNGSEAFSITGASPIARRLSWATPLSASTSVTDLPRKSGAPSPNHHERVPWRVTSHLRREFAACQNQHHQRRQDTAQAQSILPRGEPRRPARRPVRQRAKYRSGRWQAGSAPLPAHSHAQKSGPGSWRSRKKENPSTGKRCYRWIASKHR